MTPEYFAELIERAGLNLLSKYAPQFVVSLHVPTDFGVRVQCDVLSYQPTEFAQLTPERARQQIEACRKCLEKAAKTKQGVVR